MALSSTMPPSVLDRLSARLILLWAGLAVGVAFLATPAKFLARSLTLPVALDVGRQTFGIYNQAELALLVALILLGLRSRLWRRRYLALSVPGVIVAAQATWLIPALDARVSAILAGQTPPATSLHALYIGAELAKVLWLLAFGFGDLLPDRRGARRRAGAALRGLTSRHVRDGGLQ
jgi:hypothetical protein